MPSSFAGQQQDCSLFPSFFCLSFCLLLSLSQISFSSSMNPVYQISPPLPSPFSIAEPNDENHHYLQLFSPSSKASASSESSSFLSNSIFSNLAQEHGSAYDRDLQQGVHQEEAMKCVFKVGSNAHHEVLESPSLPTVDHDLMNGQQTSVYEGNYGDQYQSNGGSVKWMSSKMRLMKKMSNSDRTGVDIKVENKNKFQDHQQPPTSPLDTENSSNSYSNNNSSTTTVRVCSDCYTTKTPLWRSGPRGPKSLCNACGIRQRKARRAMAAAAAVASGGLLGNEISSMKTNVSKDKRSDNNGYTQQYKKRFKFTGPCSRNKICFEDFTINLSKNSAFHQVFPQDEKEAAILLMALSCGLILL